MHGAADPGEVNVIGFGIVQGFYIPSLRTALGENWLNRQEAEANTKPPKKLFHGGKFKVAKIYKE